jgi:CheY-like chemotaxis protein
MEKPQELTSQSYSQQNHHSSKKTVLVIDDNEDLLDLSKTMLELEDFQVFTALGGDQALALLEDIHAPDLIFLDLKMEEMSGPEFLEKLEQRMPEILETVPVVFLTGMDRVPETKAAGFIRKPIDVSAFLAATRRFIETGANRVHCN